MIKSFLFWENKDQILRNIKDKINKLDRKRLDYIYPKRNVYFEHYRRHDTLLVNFEKAGNLYILHFHQNIMGLCSSKKAAKVNMIDMTTQTKDFDYLQPNGKVYC